VETGKQTEIEKAGLESKTATSLGATFNLIWQLSESDNGQSRERIMGGIGDDIPAQASGFTVVLKYPQDRFSKITEHPDCIQYVISDHGRTCRKLPSHSSSISTMRRTIDSENFHAT
jgi:hypothetical protein